jgi:type I restriction enzyme S subunit
MSELPKGWSRTSFNRLLERIEAGLNVKCEERPPLTGEKGLVKISAVTWGRFDENQSKTLPADAKVSEAARIQPGDLLFSRANTIELVGATVLVDKIEKTLYLSDKILRLVVPDESKRWINYAMKTAATRKAIQDASSGNQLSMRNVSQEKLRHIEIPLAPLAEQKRIADKLDSTLARVDACRDRLDRIPALLKRFRQSILAAATSGRLTEDWRALSPNSCSGQDVVLRDKTAKQALLDSDAALKKKKSSSNSGVDEAYIFEVPTSWVFSSWGAIAEWITYGFTRPMPWTESGVRLATAKDVQNFQLRHEATGFTSWEAFGGLSEKDQPKRGDLLITKDGTIGRAALVRTDELFCINQSVAVCWLRSTSMNKDFLEVIANTDFTQRFVLDKAKGMAIQHLSITDFAQCPVPVPPLSEQTEIVHRVETLFAFADRLEARLTSARKQIEQLTPALLAKAFRGELVPQDPNDEPASELLKRLAASREQAPAKRGSKTASPRTPKAPL